MRILIPLFLIIANIKTFSLEPTICTGNKTVNSYSEYLKAFNIGPCNPVVYIPALMGTSLKVTADCKVMRENKKNNPLVAYALKQCPFLCNWGKKYYENVIWAYENEQWKYMYLNDFNFIWKRRECAFFLMVNHYKKKQEVSDKEKNTYEQAEIPGLEIKINGDTKNSKKTSNCGERAVVCNFGYPSGSFTMMNRFKEMGYINGLTLQAVPFDFRKSGLYNNIAEKMKFALKMVNKFTNKKSYLFSHSYGNNNVMYALKKLTQVERDTLIKEFVPVGPPFMGTLQGLFFMLGQSDWLYSPSIEKNYGLTWLSKYFDGVDPYYAKKSYPYLDAMYEFFPQINQILEYDKLFNDNLSLLKTAGFKDDFLPNVQKDIEFIKNDDVVDKAYAKPSEFNNYKVNVLDKIVEEFAFADFTVDYFKQFDYDSVSTYKNPGVSVRVILLTEVDTMSHLTLYENPKQAFDDGRFPKYDFSHRKGDQTVNLYSLTLPPLVWLSEFLKPKTEKSENKIETDTGINNDDPYKSEPREIFFVEFGQNESKTYSRNYDYVFCDDSAPPEYSYDKQGPLEKLSYHFSYYIYKTFRTGKWVLDKLKNIFVPKRYNNYNYKELPDSEQKRKEQENSKGSKKFGSNTCTYGAIISNPQFLDYISELIQNLKDNKIDKNDLIDISIDEKIFEEHISECIPVTCHKGFDECWNDFKTLFGFD